MKHKIFYAKVYSTANLKEMLKDELGYDDSIDDMTNSELQKLLFDNSDFYYLIRNRSDIWFYNEDYNASDLIYCDEDDLEHYALVFLGGKYHLLNTLEFVIDDDIEFEFV